MADNGVNGEFDPQLPLANASEKGATGGYQTGRPRRPAPRACGADGPAAHETHDAPARGSVRVTAEVGGTFAGENKLVVCPR